jgi:hypothetical protein
MPLISPGTPVTERLLFNSGYIDLGSSRLVDVQNVSLEITFVEKELRRLNSIKMAAHKRAGFKCTLKGKVKSINQEMLAAAMGTSAADTPTGTLITVKDGQQTTLNPNFTGYVDDDAAKPIQFQFTDAIFTRLPTNANLEDFGDQDFELSARDVSVFYFEVAKLNTVGGIITTEAHS